jgi:hypothetical protein
MQARRRGLLHPARLALALTGFSLAPAEADAQSRTVVDLALLSTTGGELRRVHGSVGDGSRGLPVAGAGDLDGDGFADYALAAIQAAPLGRAGAGEVYLVFGDGTVSGSLDTAPFQADILKIAGAGPSETAGSSLWMDDVSGDGLSDLLIARQNYTHAPPDPDRTGAGALTILVGGAAVRSFAASAASLEQHLDLAAPPPSLLVASLVGAATFDRLGIWVRTGDVTGDGVADIAVGADQASDLGASHHGAVYVIRGGPHLAASQTIDLADFAGSALAGHVARVDPPAGSAHFHFGGTCQVADLDGNGRAEVIAAAALNRSSAGILASGAPSGSAHATGGTADGTVHVAWDDNFPSTPWPAAGYRFAIDAAPGTRTSVDGGACNISFGEELLGGLDYDTDGAADLYVGDIIGDCSGQGRAFSGTGYVLYAARDLKGLALDMGALPAGLVTTTFLGGSAGDISSDTAAHGDFDGDGCDDLAFSSPHAAPLGRTDAGTVHVFFGQPGPWPALIDLAPALPPPAGARSAEVYGAEGTVGANAGDTLCYSAAAGDVDGDGRTDLVTNEMLGDGVLPAAEDTGNLILLSGAVFVPERVPALRPGALALLVALLLASGLAAASGLRRRSRWPGRST